MENSYEDEWIYESRRREGTSEGSSVADNVGGIPNRGRILIRVIVDEFGGVGPGNTVTIVLILGIRRPRVVDVTGVLECTFDD